MTRTGLGLLLMLSVLALNRCCADEELPGISLFRQRRFEEAITVLARDLQDPKQERHKATNYAYLAKCYEATDNVALAEVVWEILCRDFPNSVHAAEGNYFLAQQTKSRGDEAKSREFLAKATVFFKSSPTAGKAARELGDFCRRQGDQVQAWQWYSQAIRSEFSTAEKLEIKEILDPMVEELLKYQKVPFETSYCVRQGDYLTKIAVKFKTTPGMILWLNSKDTVLLHVGENLKIIANPVWVEMHRPSNFLALFFENGRYIRGYQVATSPDLAEGTYTVGSKIKDPEWHHDGRAIPPQDPENILGSRWIGFTGTVSAIHGSQGNLGQNVDKACIQMDNEDIRFLFELVAVGTEVVVK